LLIFSKTNDGFNTKTNQTVNTIFNPNQTDNTARGIASVKSRVKLQNLFGSSPVTL